ncbi:unnamed protein product, partial [Amoebophrya sp. A120]
VSEDGDEDDGQRGPGPHSTPSSSSGSAAVVYTRLPLVAADSCGYLLETPRLQEHSDFHRAEQQTTGTMKAMERAREWYEKNANRHRSYFANIGNNRLLEEEEALAKRYSETIPLPYRLPVSESDRNEVQKDLFEKRHGIEFLKWAVDRTDEKGDVWLSQDLNFDLLKSRAAHDGILSPILDDATKILDDATRLHQQNGRSARLSDSRRGCCGRPRRRREASLEAGDVVADRSAVEAFGRRHSELKAELNDDLQPTPEGRGGAAYEAKKKYKFAPEPPLESFKTLHSRLVVMQAALVQEDYAGAGSLFGLAFKQTATFRD